ncbi:MAG: efflux RND transporter periplasmic adaptor subunit [Candidatus Zixiibacteriota bacterium]
MKKKSKLILIIGGVVVVAALIITNFVVSKRDATEVYVEKVSISDLTEEVSASGYIQPETKVNITSQVTAEIISIPVKEGQTVSRGQLLAQLDTVQLQTDRDQSRFSLEEIIARTEAQKSLYLQAEEEFERQKQLYERELTSETAFKNAEYSYKNSKFSYEAMQSQTQQAQSRLDKAEDNLSKTKIIAPMNGVITYLDAEVGEIAAAQTPYSQGRTLMVISNLLTFEVEVDVDETEITKIELGQQAKIEIDAFVDTTFKGEVVEIGNTAVVSSQNSNETATNFKVKVLFKDHNPQIRPGMSATVDIITNSREQVLSIPYGAVVMRELDADSLERAKGNLEEDTTVVASAGSDEEGTDSLIESTKKKNIKEIKGVFVVRNLKAEFLSVETGIADQKNIEIINGLKIEDSIITGPYRTLRNLKLGEEISIKDMKKDSGEN